MAGRGTEAVPGTWREVRLGEVVEVVGGSTPSRAQEDYWGGDIPWVAPSELTDLPTRYLECSREGITEEGLRAAGLRLLPAGSVLLTTRATIGVTAINATPVTTNQGFQNLVGKGDTDGLWLYYCISAMRGELERRGAGSTFLEVSRDSVRSLPLLLPPLPEQRAIAAVLDSIDEAIERTDEVIAATERLRDALLHELLTRGLPGHHTAWRDVPGLGPIPACWEVVRLGEVAEVLDARRIPLNADERATMPGPYPYYGANGIVDYIDRWIFDEDGGLILLAEDGGHFDEFHTRPIAYRVTGKCWVNNHAHILKAKDPESDSFLFHSLVNKDVRPFINGSTRSKLTQADLRRIEIGTPTDAAEQRAITATLDSVDAAIERAREERAALQSSKASTADVLLTGRVRVG